MVHHHNMTVLLTRRIVRSRAGVALPIIVMALCLWSGDRSQAVSTGVVISQVYGGGASSATAPTHDFVELFNRGASPVSLTGLSLQFATGTGTLLFNQTPIVLLSGTLAPGQRYLVQMSGGSTGVPLPTPDATGTVNLSSSSGKVALVNSTSGLSCNGGSQVCTAAQLALIVDLIGYGSANFFEGVAAPGPSNPTAAMRLAGGCTDTDRNGSDFVVAAPTPHNSASPVAPCVAPDAPPHLATSLPANGATGVAITSTITVTFSEPVSVSAPWFTLTCTVSGAKAATVTGGPTVFSIDPATDFAGGETCTLTILGAQVADQDLVDPPDRMDADVAIVFTAVDVCVAPFTPISAIQGSGPVAAIAGAVTTKGVVVGDYEGPSSLRGFFIQDPTGDGDPATSDGIFVFNGSNTDLVSLGDVVRVTGSAGEVQGQTQIALGSVVKCGVGTVSPVDVMLPVADASDFERVEGMLVSLPQTLFVTDQAWLARFGEVGVSSGSRLRQPTDVAPPGALAAALQAQNDLNRLIIDDALNLQSPDPILFARNGAPLSAANTLRGGDTLTGAVGVMTYTWAGAPPSLNAYRVRPVNALGGVAMFAAGQPRPEASLAPVGATLRVASMNLLNFFNTFGQSTCASGVGGVPTECRGAADQAEFDRQWPKVVAAMLRTGADVIGTLEIENDGYGSNSALQFLVDRLNAATAPGTYAFVNVDDATSQPNALGTDAIKVAIVYKPARVMRVGQTAALNSLAFVNGGDGAPRNRPALAQAFEDVTNGGRFVLAVNHFAGRASSCDVPDSGDGQGACNAVRVQAALQLNAWLASDPTGVGDADVLIVGDLNAYSQEEPVAALEQAGYINLVPAFGGGVSYVLDGQWGSLDHAMATSSLRAQVVAAHDWAINADEPPALDYNTDFKTPTQIDSLYAPDEFRMADHNPVLVDLVLEAEFDPDAEANVGAYLMLATPAGAGAGDVGSQINVTASARFKRGRATPDGQLQLLVRRTLADGPHTYQIRATSLVSFYRDKSTGRATIVADVTIEDPGSKKGSKVIDAHARLRLTLVDRGEPGHSDALGITVLRQDGSLWFSSRWNGTATIEQVIGGGNIQVR